MLDLPDTPQEGAVFDNGTTRWIFTNGGWKKRRLEAKVVMGAATAIDTSKGELFTKTITGATTFSVTNVSPAGTLTSFVLELTNGGAGVVTYFPNIHWDNGTVPVLKAAGLDILGFYTSDGGANWRGVVMSLNSKKAA